MSGITKEGRETFGSFLKAAREKEKKMSLAALSAWLKQETGIEIASTTLHRIESGFWDGSFAFNALIAIEDAELLHYPDGRSMNTHDITEILRGRLNPFTGETIALPKANGATR